MASIKIGYSLLFDASQVVFDGFVAAEVPLEIIFVQIGFQAEDFFGYLLIFSLNPLELSLPLIEMQALCSELDSRR